MANKKKPPTETQLEALQQFGAKRGEPSRNPNGRPLVHKEAIAKLRIYGELATKSVGNCETPH